MLSQRVIENVLCAALSTGGDFAEIFVEDRYSTDIKLVGGFIENSISGRDYGIGIRVFNGFNSAYGYTNDAREENLIKVAKEVALAAKEKKDNVVLNLMKSDIQNMHPIKLMPNTVDKKRKVELLKIGYERAKGYDELITQVTANYFDEEQKCTDSQY